MNLPHHGSNPQHVYHRLHMIPPDKIIDFSVNTNPLGPPPFIKENWLDYLQDIYDYPDPEAAALVQALSEKEQLPAECILPGNGAAELIFILAQLLKDEQVLITEPAFSEYRQALEVQGAVIDSLVLREENGWDLDERIFKKMQGKKAVFICNPSNPTGRVYSRALLLEVIKQAEKTETLIICDEAFYDFTAESHSLAGDLCRFSNLIILRSVTKMYALAGIRLGYVMASAPIIKKLKKRQPHWSVNALAQRMGISCAKDTDHAEKTRGWIASEREKVKYELLSIGMTVYPSSTNYYLIAAPKEKELYPYLLKKGIVTRHTENFAGLDGNYLRIAVKLPNENQALIAALKEWKGC
ncbi:threonine-phosphate decarboxylase CobD [Metabacillus sp. FJAT-52054]|uniref:threonine-phosphate decarboxylase n=1 Tax=Metabacillus sediminis TaxID=3117746 RepID=A0ABZ2NLX3_9BACI